MGKVAREDEVYFHYPIPKDINKKLKKIKYETDIPIKDLLVSALVLFINNYEKGAIGSESK